MCEAGPTKTSKEWEASCLRRKSFTCVLHMSNRVGTWELGKVPKSVDSTETNLRIRMAVLLLFTILMPFDLND